MEIIGRNPLFLRCLEDAKLAAASNANILIEGETGTGKELIAKIIHKFSARRDKELVVINCAAMPDALLESELFGHEKGAFTDAHTEKIGLVELANNGTLVLDEIGEMSLTLQPKILRFLENGEYRKVGGTKMKHSNVRIVSSTNRGLLQAVTEGKFRRDLFYRLKVIHLSVPPLRYRKDDIPELAKYFINQYQDKYLSSEATEELRTYDWPGNVRELKNVIEQACVFTPSDQRAIQVDHLRLKNSVYTAYKEEVPDPVYNIENVEADLIKKALQKTLFNRVEAAALLGISQKTLYTKIKKYNIL